RPVQAVAVRGRQHRVARHRDQEPDLPLARRLDLVGERGHGQLAVRLGQAAHPALPPPHPVRPAPDGRFGRRLGASPRSTAANASSQVASRHREPSLISGSRSRSGSSSSLPRLAPFGRINPLLNGSSLSPPPLVTSPSSTRV